MRILFVTLLAVGLLGALPAAAHINGVSYEKEKDGYVLDAGYGAPAPKEGESQVFDFRLKKDGKDVPFTDTWVKITAENKAVVFATGIYNAEFGGPRMSYVFPKAGNYTVSFRFENKGETIVEDSFPITVLPAPQGGSVFLGVEVLPFLYVLTGIAAGVLLVLVPGLIRARKTTPSV